MKINFSLSRNSIILLASSCLALVLVVVIVMWVFVIRTPSVDTRVGKKGDKRITQRDATPSMIKQPQKTVKKAIPATATETASVPTTVVEAEKPQTPITKEAVVAEEKPPEPVTEIAKTETPKAIEKKPAPKPSYSVQVGAFRNSKNANQYVSQLKQKGYGAYIFMKTDHKARTWHTVRIGDYTKLSEASSARSVFRKKEEKPAFVTFFESLKAAPAKP